MELRGSGIIKQRPASRDAIPSITINSLLPHRLAALLSGWGGRLVHFSTDCVFIGTAGGYTEKSPSDAEDLYGKSKFLGEVADDNALTLRTSIFGRELAEFRSLLEWFLSSRGETIRGFRRVIYAGVTTNYLAELVGRLIDEHPNLSGLYQVTSPPTPTWATATPHTASRIVDFDGDGDDEFLFGSNLVDTNGELVHSWNLRLET